MNAPAEATPARRRLFACYVLIELLLLSGPFGLAQLHLAWCAWRGLPLPERFVYVPWIFAAGLILLLGGIVYDLVCRLARRA